MVLEGSFVRVPLLFGGFRGKPRGKATIFGGGGSNLEKDKPNCSFESIPKR